MPKRSYGPKPQERARCLLEALLNYADNQQEVSDRLKKELKIWWRNDRLALCVVGTLESLAELTKSGNYPDQLTKKEAENALAFLEYLEILEQVTRQGSAERKLDLKLWERDKAKNLKRFDEECRYKDSKKVTQAGLTQNLYL